MRNRLVWLVTLPIALAGVEAAHAVTNAVFGAPGGPDAEVFTGSDSSPELTLSLAALALGFVVLGLVSRATGAGWVSRRSRAVAIPFACLPPVAFLLLELLEGLVHSGAFPWRDLAGPTFLFGLALQLPFALAGYLVARALLRLSDRVHDLIRRRCVPRRSIRSLPSPRADAPRPAFAVLSGHFGRAPPRVAIASS